MGWCCCCCCCCCSVVLLKMEGGEEGGEDIVFALKEDMPGKLLTEEKAEVELRSGAKVGIAEEEGDEAAEDVDNTKLAVEDVNALPLLLLLVLLVLLVLRGSRSVEGEGRGVVVALVAGLILIRDEAGLCGNKFRCFCSVTGKSASLDAFEF